MFASFRWLLSLGNLAGSKINRDVYLSGKGFATGDIKCILYRLIDNPAKLMCAFNVAHLLGNCINLDYDVDIFRVVLHALFICTRIFL